MITCASENLTEQDFRPFGRGKMNSLVHFNARSQMLSIAVSELDRMCFGLPYAYVDCIVSTLSSFILHRNLNIRQSPVNYIQGDSQSRNYARRTRSRARSGWASNKRRARGRFVRPLASVRAITRLLMIARLCPVWPTVVRVASSCKVTSRR